MQPNDPNPYAAPRLENAPRGLGALGWFAALLFSAAVVAYLVALVNLGTLLAQLPGGRGARRNPLIWRL